MISCGKLLVAADPYLIFLIIEHACQCKLTSALYICFVEIVATLNWSYIKRIESIYNITKGRERERKIKETGRKHKKKHTLNENLSGYSRNVFFAPHMLYSLILSCILAMFFLPPTCFIAWFCHVFWREVATWSFLDFGIPLYFSGVARICFSGVAIILSKGGPFVCNRSIK